MVQEARLTAWIAAAVVTGLGAVASVAKADDRVIVKFAPGATPEERIELRRSAGAELRRSVPGLSRVQVLSTDDRAAADAAVRRLERADDVVWAERDVRLRARAIPNDPRYGDVWGLPAIGAPEAWDTTTGSASVTVAVIDSGVMTGHPDLAPNLWSNAGEVGAGRETNGRDDDGNGLVDDAHGYDFVFLDPQPDDPNGHGTHVAGTIGARGNDGAGMPGVAWSARIMPLRVLDEEGGGWGADIAQAIAYAARHGAQVANLSLGGPFSHAIDDAIRGNPELLAVAAAGNEGADVDGAAAAFPCELPHPNVVCVTATDASGAVPAYANVGATSVDVAAPGSDVLSAAPPQARVFGDDFENDPDKRWTKLDRWAPSTAQASSGSRSLAASFGAGDSSEVPLSAWIDHIDIMGYGHCRVSLTVWLDAASPGDRLRLVPAGLSPGVEVTGEGGDVAGRRISFGLDKRGIYPWSVRFELELWSSRTGSGTRGAVDDVEIRCVDREGAAADAGFTRFSGTSMAAAFASGAAGLVYARKPDASAASVRAALLDSVAPVPALAGRVATGGRLRVSHAIQRVLASRAPASTPAPVGTALPLSTGVPGAIDQSFAGGLFRASWLSSDGSPRGASAHAVLPLPDRGVLAVGTQDDALVLAQTREDGSADTRFGSQGRVRVPLVRTESERPLTRLNFGGAGRLADGRIVVSVTRLYSADATPLLVRFLADGRLDTSFGSGGVVQPSLGANTYLWHAVVDGGGRIHSVFRTGSFIDGIVRFLPDGRIDRSFGVDGVHQYEMTDPDNDNVWTGGMSIGAIHLLPDGKLLSSGCSSGRGREGVATSLRLLENGQLDPAYGDAGRADSFPMGPGGVCLGAASSVGPGGSLTMFGGAARRVGNVRPAIARLRPDGRVDQSFGLNGIVYLPEYAADSYFQRGVVLSDGRMLAFGVHLSDIPWSLVRLRPDGRWDPGFGVCGIAALEPGFEGIALDGVGRILVAGSPDGDFAVARVHGGRSSGEAQSCERPGADRAPYAYTGDATALTSGGATLSGGVWPRDAPTSVRFEYGTSTSFERATLVQTLGASPSASFVYARLSGLRPSTTYHYRIVATNAYGTVRGESYTFTTAAGPATDDPGDPPDDPADSPGEPTDPSQQRPDPTAGVIADEAAAVRQTSPQVTAAASLVSEPPETRATAEQRRRRGTPRGPAVSVSLPRQDLAQVLRGGLRLRLTCRPACTARWRAVAHGPRRPALGTRRGTRKLAAARGGAITVRVPSRAAAALRRGVPVRVELTVAATDRRGGVTSVRRFVTLQGA